MPDKNRKAMKSGNRKGQPELSATDYAIIHHVWLYYFTFFDAVQKLFFANGERDAEVELAALAQKGYLSNKEQPASGQHTASKTTPTSTLGMGEVKYYILGKKGRNLLLSSGRSVPKGRLTSPKTGQSIYSHLAALWYCVFDGPRRYRLDMREVNTLLADALPQDKEMPHQSPYCLAMESNGPVLYRLYPCRKKDAKRVPREVENRLNDDREFLGLSDWIDSGRYGYAVAVTSEARVSVAQRALQREAESNELLAKARITVHYAPTPTLLARALE